MPHFLASQLTVFVLSPSSRSGTTYQGAGGSLAHLGQDTSFSTGGSQDPEDWEEQREDRQHAIHLRKSEPYPGILRNCRHNVGKKREGCPATQPPPRRKKQPSSYWGAERKGDKTQGRNITAGKKGPSLPGAGEGCTARK